MIMTLNQAVRSALNNEMEKNDKNALMNISLNGQLRNFDFIAATDATAFNLNLFSRLKLL